MNNDITLSLIKKHFNNVEEVQCDLIRAEKWHNCQPIAIYYFDFGKAITQKEFDLVKYCRERLASDYYRHEGSLQWNYYIYFVLDEREYHNTLSSERIKEIESDRIFARKRIWLIDELNAELANPLTNKIFNIKPSEDISSRWIRELNENGLELVADPSSAYASVVKDYLENRTHKKSVISPNEPINIAEGRFINSLAIDHFRKRPEQKRFHFGIVNLIRGVNGTGKTSLLEAIELAICGGIKRQPNWRPLDVKMRIRYEGQEQEEKCLSNSDKYYRNLNLAWYGGYQRRGNQLCYNFGRFNFFNSDAAYQLSSNENNGAEIVEALNRLILGELAATIEERMRQFKVRFEKEEKHLNNILDIRKQEVHNSEKQLKPLKSIKDTRSELWRELTEKAKTIGWKNIPDNKSLSDLSALQEEIEDTATRLSNCVSQISWLPNVSISSLKSELRNIDMLMRRVSAQRTMLKRNNAYLAELTEKVKAIETGNKTLLRLKDFHSEPGAIALLGLSASIKERKSYIARLKESLGILNQLDYDKVHTHKGTLKQAVSSLEKQLAISNKTIARIKSHIGLIKNKQNGIDSIASEIKALGHRYCRLSPNIRQCPLCGANYEKLSVRIASFKIVVASDSELSKLSENLVRLQEKSAQLNSCYKDLSLIKQAAELVLPINQVDSGMISSIVGKLKVLSKELASEELKLDSQITKTKRLKLSGYEETELRELIDKAQRLCSISKAKLSNRDAVIDIIKIRNHQLDQLRKQEIIASDENRKIEKELDSNRQAISGDIQTWALDKELADRKAAVSEALDEIARMQKRIKIEIYDGLVIISTKLINLAKTANRSCQSIKEVEKKNATEKSLERQISSANHEIIRLEPMHNRASIALSVLNELLGKDYKESYFLKIVNEQKERLSTIYSRIHTPREFRNVIIDKELLLERESGIKSSISEISGGQRAALALSIFLSLNSSVSSCAPWLLFDDPVVHVDDLNLLSFFDMLRDLILIGNRQVFFATANTRVADLFAKKFDFLKTGYKEFSFQL